MEGTGSGQGLGEGVRSGIGIRSSIVCLLSIPDGVGEDGTPPSVRARSADHNIEVFSDFSTCAGLTVSF